VKFEIYHQLGFRHQWNLQSINDDTAGDGIIIAARSLERSKVEGLPAAVRKQAIFDPQFFLPAVAKGELATYDFFPQVAAGDDFQSSEYADESAGVSASRCVKFQVANKFRFIIVPTRYLSGTPGNYIQIQEELFVKPFLAAIAEEPTHNPVLLQIVITDNMLKDEEYSADLLNWITGHQEIRGVYLIADQPATSKQVKDADHLYKLLRFTSALRDNDMTVALGYLNTEAVVLAIADPSILTMGIYENTRSFRIKTFEDNDTIQRGPSPRLYISKCLQWVDRNYHGAIERRLPNGNNLFDRNKYQATMFQPSFKWHFAKPELYKHHFIELSRQLRRISAVDGNTRYQYVESMVKEAMKVFQQMERAGIVLDSDNDGSHLPAWLTAMNEFAQDKGWRS
jgi:hypothetical protein